MDNNFNSLTEAQRLRIEENRRKALEKRAAKVCQPTAFPIINGCPSNHQSSAKSFYNVPKIYPVLNNSTKPVNSFVKGDKVTNVNNGNSSQWNSSKNTLSLSSTSNIHTNVFNGNENPSSPTKVFNKIVNGSCELLSRARFCVNVGYNQKMIEIFRSIPSRMYDAQERKWNFTNKDHDSLMKSIKSLTEVSISPLPKYLLQTFRNVPEIREIPDVDLSGLDSTLLSSLFPFQKDGVCFGIHKNGRILIADDMGLGKTIQAIGIAAYYQNEWPLLVVTPSSVRYAWSEAFYKWLPSLHCQEIIIINKGKESISDAKVVILSYDLLSKKANEIASKRFQIVIMDESHFLKNPKSARTKAAQSVMKKAKRIILLTGTPALSRPIELYTQISALIPKKCPSYNEFGMRYCNGKTMPWGMDYSGSSNMPELQLFLEETVMIRRLKSEVIKQLPAKQRSAILLDPSTIQTQHKTLIAMSKQMIVPGLKGAERRGVLLKYFHETGVVKISAICDYIKDLLEAEKKFLCYGHHQVVLEAICELLDKKKCQYIKIDGSTPSNMRKEYCDRFQYNDNCRVAVLSITAANAGITLTAANLVVFAELFWNPGILTQAEDRAHRIGQQDSVVVQYLVAQGTADDHIWPLIQKKLDILNKAGLSKDNFSEIETVSAKTSSPQPTLEMFFENLSNCEEFWEQEDENEPEVKRVKPDIKNVFEHL